MNRKKVRRPKNWLFGLVLKKMFKSHGYSTCEGCGKLKEDVIPTEFSLKLCPGCRKKFREVGSLVAKRSVSKTDPAGSSPAPPAK